MHDDQTMAIGLLAYFALFFASAFFWPTWRLWRRYGTRALVVPRDDSAEGVVGRWFRATLFAIPAMLVPPAVGLPLEALGRLSWLEDGSLRLTGWILLAASLVWVIGAQAQMGGSWRIGIDSTAQPPLVKTGRFALSRNPIFLGMRLALLALFLALPTGTALAILVLGEALIQIQVRLEEAHLGKSLGAQYDTYRNGTRRWL
jgi:protein-S-isoprenylcysteine O-methyltransferase Ste14